MTDQRSASREPETKRRNASGRRTQAERRAESARRIIWAARSLYARQGYSNTTVAQIGQEAGVSAALVSHRFGSKLRLLEEVTWFTVREMREMLAARVGDKSGIDALCAEIRLLLEWVKNGNESVRALQMIRAESLSSVPEIRPILREIGRRFEARIVHVIEEGIEDGTIRSDVEPQIQARVYYMLRGPLTLMVMAVMNEWGDDHERFCDAMEDAVRRVLEPAQRSATA